MFPQGVVVRLNALLRKAVNTKSTTEVTSLADQIIKMIEEERRKKSKSLNGQDGNNQQNAGGNNLRTVRAEVVTIKTKGLMPMVVISKVKTRSKTMLTGNLIRKDRATKASRIRWWQQGRTARLVAILTRRNKTRPKCSSRF